MVTFDEQDWSLSNERRQPDRSTKPLPRWAIAVVISGWVAVTEG